MVMSMSHTKKNLFFYSLGIIFSSILLTGCSSGNKEISKLNSETIHSQQISPKQDIKASQIIEKRPHPTNIGNSAEHTETIKIGLVTSESGPLCPWGIECKKGVKLAIDSINNKGGIKGKKIELLIEDSASKASQAATAAEKLIAKGAIGILGEQSSGNSAQIAHVAYAKGIPHIMMTATQQDIVNIGSNIFRTCYSDDYQGNVMAKFSFEELQLRRVALFTDRKLPYSVGLSKGFKKKFEELGGIIVDEQFYESGQTQFSSQLTNLKAKHPEGLFIAGYYQEVGPIVRQAASLGMKVHKLGGDGWDSSEILTSGGKAVVGAYHSNHYLLTEKRKVIVDFVKKWKETYSDNPKTFCAGLSYDSALLMIEGLRKSTTLNSDALIKAIAEIENLECVTGTISFKNSEGNAQKRALVVKISEKGRIFQKSYEHKDII